MLTHQFTPGNSPVHAPSSERWMKMSEVCAIYRVHPNTVRLATQSLKLKCYRMNGLSHRRFKASDVEQWLGVEPEDETAAKACADGSIPIALVARVSGDGQARSRTEGGSDSDLSRQIGRLEEWIKENFGSRARVQKYIRVSSGLNLEHPTLQKLLSDVMSNKFSNGYIICENKERLARWAFSLIETVAKHHNTKLVVIAQAEPKTESDEWVQDILSLTHIYSCKLYAKRSADRKRINVPSDVLADLMKWRIEGVAINEMAKLLAKAGRHKDDKGRVIKRSTIQRVLQANEKAVEAMRATTFSASISHSFAMFCRDKVRQAGPGVKLARSKLLTYYRDYCKANNLAPIGSRAAGSYLRSHIKGVHFSARKTTSGEVIYHGLALLQNPASADR